MICMECSMFAYRHYQITRLLKVTWAPSTYYCPFSPKLPDMDFLNEIRYKILWPGKYDWRHVLPNAVVPWWAMIPSLPNTRSSWLIGWLSTKYSLSIVGQILRCLAHFQLPTKYIYTDRHHPDSHPIQSLCHSTNLPPRHALALHMLTESQPSFLSCTEAGRFLLTRCRGLYL